MTPVVTIVIAVLMHWHYSLLSIEKYQGDGKDGVVVIVLVRNQNFIFPRVTQRDPFWNPFE